MSIAAPATSEASLTTPGSMRCNRLASEHEVEVSHVRLLSGSPVQRSPMCPARALGDSGRRRGVDVGGLPPT